MARTTLLLLYIRGLHSEVVFINKILSFNEGETTDYGLDVCLSVHLCICVEKKNHLDVTECVLALMIRSTCFGHFCAHHQELETVRGVVNNFPD